MSPRFRRRRSTPEAPSDDLVPPALFDAAWYENVSGHPGDAVQLWRHYQSTGSARGLSPSPYVDVAHCRARHPDWRASPTLVEHLLGRIAAGEDVDPHPLFSSAEYREEHPDVAAEGDSPILHFVIHGDAEGRSPSSRFDATFYRTTYLPLESSRPFRHYVERGAALGYIPVPRVATVDEASALVKDSVAGARRPILLVGHDAQQGGAPYRQLALAEELRARGMTPVFWLLRAGPLLVDFERIGPVTILAEGWPLAGLVEGLPVDVPAVTSTAETAQVASVLARAGHRVVTAVHEMRSWTEENGLLDSCWEAAAEGAHVVVLSPRMRDEYRDGAPASARERIGTVRLGHFTRLADADVLGARVAQIRSAGDAPLFVGAGYADARKGFDRWLEAARELQGRFPEAAFVWIGQLSTWARSLLDDGAGEGIRLSLPGHVTDLAAWLAAADLFVLTSRQDPGPTVLVDAAQVGTPFVGYASDLGLLGVADVAGTFVPDDDVDALVEAAARTLAEETAARRTSRAQIVEESQSFPRHVDDLLSLVGVDVSSPGDPHDG